MEHSIPHPSPFRVGIVPIHGFALMSYACLVEPLRAANLLAKRPLYDIGHFGSEETVQSSGAASISGIRSLDKTLDLDLLLVVAGGDPFAVTDPLLLAWLQTMADKKTALGGVSGGSVILARAGLLSGRRMTVHWEHAAELAERFPDLVIERRLFVIDRDRVTCGGGTAPTDLMHALIARDHGQPFAKLVSDWFLHTDVRMAAAPQRALSADLSRNAPAAVAEAVAAMENHVADPLTLAQLALMSGVSSRHLNRLFQETFGLSAISYYRQLRLDVGRRLVTGSSLKIAEIAEATGFASVSHFSNQYTRQFNQRPRRARQLGL
jgi:transcriptional regulator GlxA family with amidase domain